MPEVRSGARRARRRRRGPALVCEGERGAGKAARCRCGAARGRRGRGCRRAAAAGGEAGGEDEFLLPSPRHVCGEVWRGARGAPRGARRCAVRAVRAARGLREWGWRCAASERVRAAVPGRPGAAAERLCAHLKAFAARS